jgi:hypothetical protein
MTEEELKALTPEERQRMAGAEQEALQMFYRNINEGRWYPRKTARFACLVVAPALVALVAVIYGLYSLIEYLLTR